MWVQLLWIYHILSLEILTDKQTEGWTIRWLDATGILSRHSNLEDNLCRYCILSSLHVASLMRNYTVHKKFSTTKIYRVILQFKIVYRNKFILWIWESARYDVNHPCLRMVCRYTSRTDVTFLSLTRPSSAS